MTSAIFFKLSTFTHIDARIQGQFGIGVLNRTKTLQVIKFLSRLPSTPSNFSSQYSKPSLAETCLERTSLVDGFQAIIALALAPPTDVPTPRISVKACALPSPTKEIGSGLFL